jgi:hypothetical protein
MSDIEYHDGDNVFDNTINDYSEVTSAMPKVQRLILMHQRIIEDKNGNLVPTGNRFYVEEPRPMDSPANREKWKRYLEEALAPLVGSNEIRDLVVTNDDPETGDGVATRIEFFDIPAGRRNTVSAIPPWARA